MKLKSWEMENVVARDEKRGVTCSVGSVWVKRSYDVDGYTKDEVLEFRRGDPLLVDAITESVVDGKRFCHVVERGLVAMNSSEFEESKLHPYRNDLH